MCTYDAGNYIVKNTLQELEGVLVDKDFIRVSRTHLVNLSSVWRFGEEGDSS